MRRLGSAMVGKSISHYDILSKAGEGGMGVVYHGRDRRLGRDVALKFLFPEALRSQEARTRFEREARLISSVSHPNIATLFTYEDSAEGTFLVFEFLPGGSLAGRMPSRERSAPAIPLRRGLEWAIQIADGLAHAHRRGIIHRDIKPANILFDGDDRLKLSDFGLAKGQQIQGQPGEESLTRAGVTLGTAAYMAPEQAIGAEANAASDIYSYGVVLYELFTGRRPFPTDDTRGVFYHLLHTPPTAPAEWRPDLPDELNLLILSAIEKQPRMRPSSMDEIAGQLRQIQMQTEAGRNTDTQTVQIPSRGSLTGALAPGTGDSDTRVPDRSERRGFDSAGQTLVPPGRRKWLMGAMALALVLLALAVVPLWSWLAGNTAALPLPDERKVAVLMFENLDDSPEQEAFCNGLTDSLTAVITQMGQSDKGLWVVPASEVRSENVRSIREARRLFGVNLAVTGSLRRVAKNVRVTLSLVDAEATKQVDSRTVEVAQVALPTLEPKLIQAVGTMLRSNEASSAPVLNQPPGLAASAYEHYIQGLGLLQRFDLPGNLSRATRAFEQALEKQPDYALAVAGLGEAYLAKHSVTQDPQWLAKAQTATERAVELDPKLAAAHVNLSILYERTSRFEKAIAEGRLARDLDPLNADAYRALAHAYSSAGNVADAEQTYRQAIDLRPGFWLPYKDLGVHYLNTGRYADAERMFRLVIQKTPDNEWGYRNLATVYHFTGRFPEAEAQLLEAVSRRPTGESYSNLGTIYYVQGRFAEATKVYRKATELSPNDSIVWGNLGDSLRATPSTRGTSGEVYRKAVDLGERQLSMNAKDPQLLLGMALYWAKIGDHTKARGYLVRAEKQIPENATFHYQSAIIQELAGDRNQSLRSLTRAVRQGYPVDEIAREPELAGLRNDNRYKSMLARRTDE